MGKTFLQFVLGAILISGTFSCTQKPATTTEEARSIAKEAYIYTFPMVMGYKAMNAYVLDQNSPEHKGPFNHLSCDARLLTPEDKAVVTPNSDTPYCMGWVDLSKEPVVISVPEMVDERFYHFQLVDMYTHNFNYIGTLSTGNGAGNYLVTTMGWQGVVPDGISQVYKCETPLFFIIVRTQLFGPDDLPRVKEIQGSYKLQTLSEYDGGPEAKREETIDIPEWNEGDQFTTAIFKYADAMFDLIHPVEEEKELFTRFAKIGLGEGVTFNMDDFDPEVQQAIEEGVKEGQAEIEAFVKDQNRDPLVSAKIFGTRKFLTESAKKNFELDDFYLLRATAAHLGLYGNSGKEAMYPVYLIDSAGAPLDASGSQYTMTFADGKLPPVKSFWSVTMYDGKTQLLVSNPLNRYLLNSSMMEDFVFGDDGSLTFYIQHNTPGKNLESNWLPAPDGPFYVVMRLYGPEEPALQGKWKNPPIVRTSD